MVDFGEEEEGEKGKKRRWRRVRRRETAARVWGFENHGKPPNSKLPSEEGDS